MEERRLAAIPMFEAKQPLKEIPVELGVHHGTVEHWSMKYRHGGPAALKRSVSSGRPAQLSAAQEQQLLDTLELGCAHHGFPTEQWTMKRIVLVVRRLFGVIHHIDGLRPKFRLLGLSFQKPGRRTLGRDEAATETCARETVPALKWRPCLRSNGDRTYAQTQSRLKAGHWSLPTRRAAA